MKIKDFCTFAPKSKIKAGQAIKDGQYMFFTSSKDENKRYIDYLYDGEAIIMGTGGNATLHYYKGKYAVSTDCVVLNPDERIRCKYLYYFFLANMAILEAGFKGAGLKHTNRKYIENIVVSKLPTFDEQDSVIKILDKISDIIRFRNLELKVFDNLIKARFVEMFGNPVSNPYGWKKVKLSELGTLARGKSKHRPRNAPELLGGPYPLIQTGDVAAAGLYITECHNTYSELGLRQSRMWKAGTLCITIAANIAQTAIMTFDACFPDSVVGFVPVTYIGAVYMHYWFSFFRKILEEQAPQVAQKNINLQILSDLSVIVPPQERISAFNDFVWQVNKSKFALINDIL